MLMFFYLRLDIVEAFPQMTIVTYTLLDPMSRYLIAKAVQDK